MRKNLKMKLLVSLMASSSIFTMLADNDYLEAANVTGNGSGGVVSTNSDLEKNQNVYGLYGDTENDIEANNATVTMTGGSTNFGGIYGGKSINYGAKHNSVTISGATIDSPVNKAAVIGGQSDKGEVSFNNVIISDTTITNHGGSSKNEYGLIMGGYSSSSADVTNNTVELNSGTVINYKEYNNIYGGKTVNGKADNNSVKINGANIEGIGIYGGYASGTSTTNNSVEITDGNITVKEIYGAKGGSSSDNKVIITGGSVNKYGKSLDIYGAYGGPSVENNKVEIASVGVNADNVYGGYTTGTTVKNNTVKISNGTVGNVYGGYKDKYNTDNAEVSENNIILEGGEIKGNIYAGYKQSFYPSDENKEDKNIHDNIIILNNQGNLNLDEASLYGSNRPGGESNNLVVNNKSTTVGKVNNFSNINFESINWENGKPLLTIKDGTNSNLSETNINAKDLVLNGGKDIENNESMALIKAEDGKLNVKKENVHVGNFTAGVAQEGTGTFNIDENGELKYTISSVHYTDQINLVAENRAVAAAFLNQSGELISQGLDSLTNQPGYGFKTFAAVYGNHSKYDVNSDLKINGWSEIIGVGNTLKFKDGKFDYGIFFENGSGDYRTYNSFNNEFFRGDGSLVYNGGGIAGRYKKDNGLYIEGSLHAGTLKNEMNNALKDGLNNFYNYKSDTAYYGGHIGIGKIFDIDNDKQLDVFGKFFHTYSDGDEFSIAHDRFEFDSITSDRLQIGAKFITNKDNKWSTHYGLAWEYEFNGDADMRVGQYAIPTQSLQGSTIIGEIGLTYQDEKYSPWNFNLNMRGYEGEREGISGNILLNYNF